jgi:hypothetical protein
MSQLSVFHEKFGEQRLTSPQGTWQLIWLHLLYQRVFKRHLVLNPDRKQPKRLCELSSSLTMSR